mgnify:CR=1 FL=1
MEKYILDTNLFFNMEADLGLGKNTKELVVGLTKIIKKQKNKQFLMTPSAINEFLSFFSDEQKKASFVNDFLSSIIIQSPDYNKINISAIVFYKLIKEIRTRSYRGLNIAEEEIKKAAKMMMGVKNLTEKEFQIKIGEIIKKLRERYRQATRFGFLDSTTDLDLIILAKEVDGFLISTDEGMLYWGRILAVKEILPQVWLKRVELS